jgi:VWFA-related protein
MFRCSAAALAFVLVLRAQQSDAPSPENTVFSVTTTLVQVDAVVTDSKGRQVTTLKPEDFDVLLDRKAQRITNFSYVHLDSPDVNHPALSPQALRNPGQASPAWILKPADVHRSMVLLVDDLGLSFESMHYVRRTLRKFIDEQMQPGDLVAIWETGRSNSVFQQFTADKHVLAAAIENLKWNPRGRGVIDAFPQEENRARNPRDQHGPPTLDADEDEQLWVDQELALGSLGTLDELLEELRQVGGRKAVVLFSDGLATLPEIDNSGTLLTSPLDAKLIDLTRRLIDKANRSGTVIYTVDARGLLYLPPRATARLWSSQQGLVQLAEDTGGAATINSNGYSEAMQSIEEDQKGYYLIGFKAPDDISNGQQKAKPGFHSIRVKVRGAGLRVRSRSGFLGETDEASLPKRDTPEAQMRAAVQSLFNQSGLRVRLTALFERTPDGQPFVHNLLYIDPRDIRFQTDPDGKHKAALDVVVLASGYGLDPLAAVDRHILIEATSDRLKQLQKDGIRFTLNVPVKHAGPYQVRASVRDSSSTGIGAAGQYIDIPDLQKQHIALASLRLADASSPSENRFDDVSAALREFHAGSRLAFVSLIETARDDRHPVPSDGFEAEIQLYQDNTPILTLPVPVRTVVGESAPVLRGVMHLGSSLPPGQYYLKAVVTDRRTTRARTATTWTEFQVIPTRADGGD